MSLRGAEPGERISSGSFSTPWSVSPACAAVMIAVATGWFPDDLLGGDKAAGGSGRRGHRRCGDGVSDPGSHTA